MEKLIRVHMDTLTVTEETAGSYKGLGGRALTSHIVGAEVPPLCHALGRNNKLVFAPGLLAGTNAANSGRLSAGAKSPLTGGIKESNVGGTVSADLARLGVTAVIIEGQARLEDLFVLKIDSSGDAALIDAKQFKGMRTY